LRALGIAGLPLGLFFARQNGLHHIARLGDVRKVNLGTIFLLIA
jgi:hypothetical protein